VVEGREQVVAGRWGKRQGYIDMNARQRNVSSNSIVKETIRISK
jgi:hypothetical protein